MWIKSYYDEELDDDVHRLLPDAQVIVARWIALAIEQGGFDWDLLCTMALREDAVAERYRLVYFLNEMRCFDDLELPDYPDLWEDDGEIEEENRITVLGLKADFGAILLTFFFNSISNVALAEGVLPSQLIAGIA